MPGFSFKFASVTPMIVFISFFILVCYIRLLRYLNFYDPSCTIYPIYSNDSDVSLLLVLNIYIANEWTFFFV